MTVFSNGPKPCVVDDWQQATWWGTMLQKDLRSCTAASLWT